MAHKNILFFILLFFCSTIFAQNDPTWDDTSSKKWSSAFEKIEIPSSADGSNQRAYIYGTKSKIPKPLIVSLHTWSGNYEQKDPLVAEILARDWNYIHPDFRGKSNKPEAMGSALVISDIEDAINYALKHTNSDPDDVHIIGVSGGGYATLISYMNIVYPIKSFSAWVPISDIETWYWESVGRKGRYAKDILGALATDDITTKKEDAKARSPLYQAYPKDKRKNAKLYIYAGVHDGYKGSVPITHSINMYNRLVGEQKYGTPDLKQIMLKGVSDSDLVSESETTSLLTKRLNSEVDKKKRLFDRDIHLSRAYKNIQLTIFEGGHEQLPQALALIPYEKKTSLKYNILTIGDSNAQKKYGWVEQLKKMMPDSKIINISEGGRTIGFDNKKKENLNGLKNIDSYLDEAQNAIGNGKFDYIIVCLGTNDTKKEFENQQDEVVPNLKSLFDKIKNHDLVKKSKPKFIYITPPPLRVENIDAKYQGGNERLSHLIPQFKSVATEYSFAFIDVFYPLQKILDYYASDGVHMSAGGQEIISLQVVEELRKKKK